MSTVRVVKSDPPETTEILAEAIVRIGDAAAKLNSSDITLAELEKSVGFDPSALCVYCELPVGALSFGGPRVCPACDCGHNRDGTKWTNEQAQLYYSRTSKIMARLQGL